MLERRPWLRCYGIACAAFTVALALKLIILPPDLAESPFLLLFAAVAVSARYGGLGQVS